MAVKQAREKIFVIALQEIGIQRVGHLCVVHIDCFSIMFLSLLKR